MVSFVRALREHPDIDKEPSVRASLGLYERAQSLARLNNHPQVKPFDVMEAMISVLAHRIKLKPSVAYIKSPTKFLKEEFAAHAEREGFSIDADDVP